MNLLQEIINPNTVNLTDTQQGVLITIKLSPTPEVAYESTNGSEQSVYARNSLRTLSLIKVGDNKAILTQNGEHVLLNYNLTDETGQLTERGTETLNNFRNKFNKNQNQNQNQNQNSSTSNTTPMEPNPNEDNDQQFT